MRWGALLLIAIITGMLVPVVGAAPDRPLVVTTIAPLASIVGEAFGNSVDVEYIIPPGADPHEYQLNTEQIALLQRAAVIVTTGGHLPVEKRIAELEEEGTLKGKALFASDYKACGFRYLPEYWYRGKDNPHGVWLDPNNALAIAEATEKALEAADPSRAATYREDYARFKARVDAIVESYRALAPKNGSAVINMAPDEYALSWLGIRAVASIKPEEEVPAIGVDKLLPLAKKADVIVYGSDSPSQLKNAALELASKSGKPTAEITVFWSGKPYTEVLINNSAAVLRAFRGEPATQPPKNESSMGEYVLLSLIVGVVLGTALGVTLKK